MIRIIMVLLLIAVIAILLIPVICPPVVVQHYAQSSFVIEKEFSQIRNQIISGKFEDEMAKANQMTYISKEWKNLDFNLSRPLRRSRDWSFNGDLKSKVSINSCEYDLRNNLIINKNNVEMKITLIKPLALLGEVALDQNLEIKPFNNKTIVNVKIDMKVKHVALSWKKQNAKQILEKEADRMIASYKEVLSNLPKGITVPLKN